jgi:hypothetical protein
MSINTETHISKTVILPREVCNQIELLAMDNGRSVSAQIVFMLKRVLRRQLKEDSK